MKALNKLSIVMFAAVIVVLVAGLMQLFHEEAFASNLCIDNVCPLNSCGCPDGLGLCWHNGQLMTCHDYGIGYVPGCDVSCW